MSLAPGSHLQGFEIRRQLGAGGMGVVYLAHDLKLGRSVAIKVLPGELAGDPARTRRFEQEARAASALNHPNVCVVHALGETPDGHPFIAMEYVEGHTLRHLLHARPPGLRDALDIAIQIAAGVGAAHALGIIHRDLKPENVLVRDDGVVKVLDFGLAKLVAGGLSGDVNQATRTLVKTDAGVVMGTFTYMAPEQARGVEVDARADIWSLGVILYEMVAGRVPFAGDTRSDVLAAILEREPAPLDRLDPAVPHELQRIVAKALRKDRAQRYQTITDLRLDLEVLRGELQAAASELSAAPAVLTAPVATPAPVRRESSAEFVLTGLRRHKLATGAVLLVAVAAAAAAVRWLPRAQSAREVVPAAPRIQRGLTRLTVDQGLQTDPTFSPDGRFIAYAADRAGNFGLWVQPVTGGDPVQITKSVDQDTQPDWSPDGSTIVFRSEREGGGLFLVPALGGLVRKLSTFGLHPKWSADGSRILFLVGPSLDSGEGLARVYSIAPDGGVPRELAASFLADGSWRWIAAHPDGRLSAIGESVTGGFGFFTFTADGKAVVKSAVPKDFAVMYELGIRRMRFQWNATGSAIFLEAPVNGLHNLWRIDVDPATLAWRGMERLTTGAEQDVAAALSRDGTRLAFSQQRRSSQLWTFPLDPSGRRLAGQGHSLTEPGEDVEAFSLSRDGDALVYLLQRAGIAHRELWLSHFTSGSRNLLGTDDVSPVWSPDASVVAFTKRSQNGTALFLRTLKNSDERQISPWTQQPVLLPQSWGPDGRFVLVTAVSDTAPLWWWPLAGGEKPTRVLLDLPQTSFWQASYSPDGRWLMFVPESVDDPAHARVVIAPADGGPPDRWVPLGLDSPWVDKPRWGSDGRSVYCLAKGQDGFFNLHYVAIDPATGHPVSAGIQVTHFNAPSLMISPYVDRSEIAVSSKRALLTMLSSTGSVWMLDTMDK